ncbi:12583_t:CDS:2 [Ambispora gerdemannii]|uniref:12583_t:CDS:1 n=1 Tax=Ambispora gerdemannii TaxID=144530 RepID=A0A9N8ZTB0_9GLOM|nr:12583_t:CDS:2 [Ambispora gerdemannii]
MDLESRIALFSQTLPQTTESLSHRYRGNKAMENGDYNKAYAEYSKGITINPHDPALWCNRALTFLKLGYPELAIVDAQRTINTLDEFFRDYKNENSAMRIPPILKASEKLSIDQKMIQLKCKAKYRECLALANLELYVCATRSCKDLLKWKDLYADANVPFNWNDVQSLLENFEKKFDEGCARIGYDRYSELAENYGKYKFNGSYPWDSRQQNRASDETFDNLQQQILQASYSQAKIVKMTFEESGEEIQYGLEAQCIIPKHKVIFEEAPFISVNSKINERCDYCNSEDFLLKYICPKSGCKEIFCNVNCYKRAYELYHKVTCGKDFSEIVEIVQNGVSTSALTHLYPIKLFAIGKIRDICPLDIDEIKHLRRWEHEYVTFQATMLYVYDKVMALLGIPIGDLRFDFWVFISLCCAMQGNVFGDKTVNSVPDYSSIFTWISLINHDCNPNAILEINESKWQLKANKKIRKGDAITLTYVGYTWMNNKDRCRMLYLFRGIKCKCENCIVYLDQLTRN